MSLPTSHSSVRPKFNGLPGWVWVTIVIVLSAMIILFNKWILDRFPFAIILSTWHMLFATVATQILARTTSSINTSREVDSKLYWLGLVPVSVCFSLGVVLSNMSYLYLGVGFIQMVKTICPISTLLACWSIGLRNPPPALKYLLAVCVIMAGVLITCTGEVRVVFIGAVIQAVAIIFESYKNAFQQLVLADKSMSSLTLLYYFAPICTVLNLPFIFAMEAPAIKSIPTSPISLWILLANGILTFLFNIATATAIKKTSGTVLALSGILKAFLLVVIDVIFYGTTVTILQVIGFSIAGAGLYHYSRLNSSSNSPLQSVSNTKVQEESLPLYESESSTQHDGEKRVPEQEESTSERNVGFPS